MTTLPNLTPDSTGTVSGVFDEASGTTSLHLKVSDASDATYLTGGLDAGGTVLLGLSDVPGDFANMDTLGYEIRLHLNGTQSDDSMTFSATVYDGNATTTPLTNTVQVATHADAGGAFNLKTGAFTIQGTPTATQWNNAFLHFEWTYSKNMASDGISIRVSEAAVTGTYTTTNAPPNTPVITNPTDLETVGGAVSLEATITDPEADDVYARWEVWKPSTLLDSFSSIGVNPTGLAFDGTDLWQASAPDDQIYRISVTGTLLNTYASPSSFPQGIAFNSDYTRMWNADGGDDRIYELDPANPGGAPLNSFQGPTTSLRGLTHDGTALWVTGSFVDTIWRVNQDDGTVLNSFAAPATRPNDLAWDGANLWNVDTDTDLVYKLDPTSGDVLSSFAMPTPSGNAGSLVHDGTDFYSGDINLDTIYKFTVPAFQEDVTVNTTAVPSGGTHATNWDSTVHASGDYELRAWGRDVPGGESASYDSITVSISAPPNAPTISAPTAGAILSGGSVSLEASATDPDGDTVYMEWEVLSAPTRHYDDVTSTTLWASPFYDDIAHDAVGGFYWAVSDSDDMIYKLDATDGTVLDSWASTQTFPRCIAWDGTHVYTLETDSGLNARIYKYNPDGSTVTSWQVATNLEDQGLEWDGTQLLIWDSSTTRTTISTWSTTGTAGPTITVEPDYGGWPAEGVAWDGTGLWVLRNQHTSEPRMAYLSYATVISSTVYEFTEAYAIDEQLQGLTWNGSSLTTRDVTSGEVVTIDPTALTEIERNVPVNTTPVASGATHTTTLDATTLAGGDKKLRVYAVDTAGLRSDPSTVDVSVNTGADPTITAPLTGATLSGTVSLEATATDPEGDAVYVSWKVHSGAPPAQKTGRAFNVTGGTFPRGIAWDGTHLWQHNIIDNVVERMDTTGLVVSTIPEPNTGASGLAHDGTNLWFLQSSTIYKLDPADGTVLDTLTLPTSGDDLTWDGTNLWYVKGFYANTDLPLIYKLDATGSVIGSFELTGLSWMLEPAGLAWDATTSTMWVNLHRGNGDPFPTLLQYEIDGSALTLVGRWTFPDVGEDAGELVPRAIEHDGTNIWTINHTLGATSADGIQERGATFLVAHNVTENTTTVTSGATHTTSWDSSQVAGGDYYLAATGVDEFGNIGTTEYVAVTVEESTGVSLVVNDSTHGHVSEEVSLTVAADVVVQEATHTHQSENVTITYRANAPPEDSHHAHASEQATLTENPSLSVEDSHHAHSADKATAVPTDSLNADDSNHAHVSESPTLSEHASVVVADSRHGHTSDPATASATYAIVAGSATHGHTSGQVTVTEHLGLVAADSSHPHTSEQATLTENPSLSVEDSRHAHTSDKASAVPLGTVDANDANHAHTSDEASLTEHASVSAEDSRHGHASEPAIVSATYSVIPNDATHGHTADGVTATENPVLDAQDSSHGHAVEQATLTENPSLSVDDSHHAHSADKATAVPQGTLDVNDSSHAHTSGQAVLSEQASVVVLDSAHGHDSEQVALTVAYDLVSGDATHGHDSEGVSLTEHPNLVVGDSLHGHASEEVALTEQTSGDQTVVPGVVPVFEAQAPVVDAGIGIPMPVTTARVYMDGEFKQRSVKIYRDGKFV